MRDRRQRNFGRAGGKRLVRGISDVPSIATDAILARPRFTTALAGDQSFACGLFAANTALRVRRALLHRGRPPAGTNTRIAGLGAPSGGHAVGRGMQEKVRGSDGPALILHLVPESCGRFSNLSIKQCANGCPAAVARQVVRLQSDEYHACLCCWIVTYNGGRNATRCAPLGAGQERWHSRGKYLRGALALRVSCTSCGLVCGKIRDWSVRFGSWLSCLQPCERPQRECRNPDRVRLIDQVGGCRLATRGGAQPACRE